MMLLQFDELLTGKKQPKKFNLLGTWTVDTYSWNPKQPDFYGCFNWMIPNLYLGNGCFTKHPFKRGCLGFQVQIKQVLFASTQVTQINPSNCPKLHRNAFPPLPTTFSPGENSHGENSHGVSRDSQT